MPRPVLEAKGLAKKYGQVSVLSDVTLDIRAGEVHAIIGENGAGKSTLMRLLSGYVEPTSGSLWMDSAEVVFPKPAMAQASGIVLVHQEILLAEALTVAENLFLGRELTRNGIIDDRTMQRITSSKLAEIGCRVSPSALVRDISLADRQLVQIARALLDNYRLVIFDEPTAVLTSDEVETLLAIIVRLKNQGIAILYISHRLDEVQRLADRVTVLRDGKMIGTYPGRTLSQMDMANLMVGRELATLYPKKSIRCISEPMLEVSGATVPGFVSDISFAVHKGEILGFGGMIGAGRTELFEGILGLRPGTAKLRLRGESIHIRKPLDAIEAGIGYLTEDRKGKGLLLGEQLASNLTLSALSRVHPHRLLRKSRDREALVHAVDTYDIRLKSYSLQAGQLSGGNQQKLLLAKVLLTNPSVVIIDEPTRGIDIANKAQIYSFIHKLVETGKACIVISSEMQELIGICDRILVMREGRISGEVTGADMTENKIALLATSNVSMSKEFQGVRHT
ncbi:sugar ABC transporter ATP-binding protein [Phyllobacterium endophyticum]|uniref:ABC transporter ATP-binding protein n=1 Tax=Phyllobacterium endophyticum TaxID=1149773 RepID=A0A2P7AP94_9HYPH|nr:sugar ABC transporter ATP-binding protein [Phyllobacterium endophyticum]MBB3233619.1 ribose transport system ATP-binding protein [Phyllobacterium endophyticum]PSH56018.1 ABC transporter ATP-binding protein [Phyllobacterium endophyticum]TXR47305.1 sugar ABC transporter ATP-binding protein [Phyllobacterium endophyticum]TYR41167.1 sugar ABC transporter ATP-binding protein [Phyllobacterium endophyticum]